ncbi:YaaC family protein [Halalkalibacter krulwichiae]|uniref:YaaC-like Protein n=1 Tax=Halalkalibacter krulwichiae TaxID=199441 RepID=A0A1X9MD83_9BACI|nr:YaaC family protein [Halalkalibacter krulwichiae]ARK28402.1 hypothetical protein BkAM31D_00060 [Halalkalibacter krulwichiae]
MKLEHYDLFIPFYSSTYTSKFLLGKYEQKEITQAKTKSYQVSSSFMYHLQHGQLYFKQAQASPIEIKPVLLFYGYVQMLKACILTTNPNYPENSQVLAHGVTTRKRKKATYRFLEDEVKVQKNGLYSLFLDKMFHMKHLEGEKYQMVSLLLQIADMHELFLTLQNKKVSIKGSGNVKVNEIEIPSAILDLYHMTSNRFEQYLESLNPSYKGVKVIEQRQNLIIKFKKFPNKLHSFPFLFNTKEEIFIFTERQKLSDGSLPELATHFLLLYNLSMICRYEAEWWGDLIHTFDGVDYPFIAQYVNIVQNKIPSLIYSYLLG